MEMENRLYIDFLSFHRIIPHKAGDEIDPLPHVKQGIPGFHERGLLFSIRTAACSFLS